MLEYSKEIKEAVHACQAVVALESTIIAHGMPFPKNVETALRVEQTVRDAGAIPATCAVINGRLKAGLSTDELELLGRGGALIPKASRRDLPFLLAGRQNGATTVAATMMVAHLAGIQVFATGGIGGVHRGATHTMDISADLQELAHTPVAVVCAGAKSILDLGLTLEYLETHGVPVVGYQTRIFPAFYTRESCFGVDGQLDSPAAIAELLLAKWSIDQRGGVLIANPVPEKYSLPPDAIEAIIQQALQEADQQGIKGKAITPFLLHQIEQISGGNSLLTNIELVCNNAQLAAAVAQELAFLKTTATAPGR